VVSPFSFPIYASAIRETMMLEDPAMAVERIYREMYSRVEAVTAAAKSDNPKVRDQTPQSTKRYVLKR
jgi:hypothetical protein